MTECAYCGATDTPDNGIVVSKIEQGGDSMCNVCLADHLKNDTVLSRREADVTALKLQGHSHGTIADLLGIEKSTVDEYSRRMKSKAEKAANTYRDLDRYL